HAHAAPAVAGHAPDAPKHWYEKISLRGYTQMRYNGLMSGGPFVNDISSPADRSIGNKRNFLIRRARLIFSGDVSDHLYIYIQPDLASAPNRSFSNASTFTSTNVNPDTGVPLPLTNAVFGTAGGQVGTYSDNGGGNFAQLRDAYADISIDHDKEFRVRAGQSKIPYGFVNMQSSQNRLPLDRADALNTCCRDERDLGLFFYYAPKEMRHLFRDLVSKNLKGSGDYGMFALGVYNGQGANRFELNQNVHVVSRLTYPYVFANGQIVEASIQGYTGRFMPVTASITPSLFGATFDAGFRPPGFFAAGVPFVNGSGYGDAGNFTLGTFPSSTAWRAVNANGGVGVRDQRLAVTGVLYPQPFGLTAEWNWGVGPRLDETQTVISARSLNGGYVQAMYKYEDKMYGTGTWFPFVQW
ncbi:MAG: porin, partial [Methylocella sp.]